MSSRKENWKSRDEDSGRQYSRDHRSRRPAFGSPRSFSRADDRKVFFVPYYKRIREEEHVFEDFRRSLRYLGDYSEDSELDFSLEKLGFHYLDTQFRPDDTSKVKKVDFDLKVASDLAESFKGDMRLFTNFLQWIASKPNLLSRLKMETETKRAGGTFVARAPIFQMMLDIPFKRYADCSFSAICISGSIYIEAIIPEAVMERIMKDLKLTEHDLEDIEEPESPESSIHVWSHKYEQYMCGELSKMEACDYEEVKAGLEPIFVNIKEEFNPDDYEDEEQIFNCGIAELKEDLDCEDLIVKEEFFDEDKVCHVPDILQNNKSFESPDKALVTSTSALLESRRPVSSLSTSESKFANDTYEKRQSSLYFMSYKCNECSWVAQTQFKLEAHVKYHRSRAFKCSECDYIAPTRSQLRRHVRTHTGEKPFKCSECGYRTGLRETLKAHIRLHTGETPYQCNFCNYKAGTKSDLNSHLRVHTNEKPFQCIECDYRTTHRSALKIHLRQHTGEKPFKCVECDYSTRQKRNLDEHMRRHTGEKPFKCDFCGFECASKTHLIDHTRIHTGEKPYSCNQCSYRAGQKSNLKRHLTKHTTEKPFRCDKCDYGAGQKIHLKRHLIAKHAGGEQNVGVQRDPLSR